MYNIKEIPEDFIVEEMPDYSIKESGRFYVYVMQKRNRNTIDAVREIAARLCMNEKAVGYAGLKDKVAITRQYITLINDRRLLHDYAFKDLTLELVGFRDERIFPGCLSSNRFEIVIRNLKIDLVPEKIQRMVNYYGEQRFSRNNAEIGKSILNRDYKRAVKLIQENGNAKYPLEGNNYPNFLQRLDKKLLILYLQSYQSHIWNICAARFVGGAGNRNNYEALIPEAGIPIVGFGMEKDDKTSAIVDAVMAEERISERDFILKVLPELSLEGGRRRVYADVTDLKIGEPVSDERHHGMKKCTVKFILPKGSYATECIKQMFV